jgi:hypothetical protein
MLKVVSVPPGERASSDFSVLLNGTQRPGVYKARVSAVPYNRPWPGCQRPIEQTEIASFFSYEADEAVTVRLETKRSFKKVIVRPRSKNILPVVKGNIIEFTLNHQGQYTVEIDGYHHALHIFCKPEQGI